MPRLQLVIFDMDGVIFQGCNFWLDLHRTFGTDQAALDLADLYMTNDYRLLSRLTVEDLWAGKSARPFIDLIETRRLMPGAKELFNFLNDNGIRTAIISSGPYQLAQRAQKLFGIDQIRANHVMIEGKRFVGTVDVQVEDSKKDLVAKEIMEALGASYLEAAGIGDSLSDAKI